VFLISGIAETARSPFDLLEADSEIVAGFHIEYSGMKFALFFLGEYVNALAVAFIFATIFLGGYAGPVFIPPYIILLTKAAAVFTLFMWLRGTLPRVRVDQMHDMNWKFFVPLSVVNLIIVLLLGKIFPAGNQEGLYKVSHLVQAVIMFVSTIIPFLLALNFVAQRARKQRLADAEKQEIRKAENRAAVAAH
jgi:NADH-quinone oxidoreductase subunit H